MAERMEAHKVNSEEHRKKVSAKVLDYLRNGKCSDVVLVSKIDGKRLKAHRMVLSACSEYFERIFMQKETIRGELELEIDEKVLDALRIYCYTGEIGELEVIAEDFMEAAAQYLIQPVVDDCARYLADHLERSNCLKRALLAERYNLSDLLEKAKVHVCQNFTEVSKTGEFLQLTFENVRSIIASDDLQVPCEEDVLNFVLSWLQYDWSNRRAHFPSLMEWIRLPLLPSSFLKDNNLGSDRECSELMKLMEQYLETEGTNSQGGFLEAPRKGSSAILIVEENYTNPQNLFYGLRSLYPQSGIMKEWSTRPDGRRRFGVTLLGRNLIIAGGYTRNALKTAYIQNLETKTWTALSPMLMSRQNFSLVALNEFVYAIGGKYEQPLYSVERLDPSNLKNTWEYVAPMSCSRGGLAAAALEGRLYVAGGFNSSVTNSVECYDPKTNKWTERAPMIYARMFFTAVSGNGYMYVIGGEDTKYLDTVERYDPKENKWTQLCSLIDARKNIAAAIIGNRIFAMGGEHRGQDWIQEYNVVTDKWTKTISFDEQVFLTCAITVPNFYSLNST